MRPGTASRIPEVLLRLPRHPCARRQSSSRCRTMSNSGMWSSATRSGKPRRLSVFGYVEFSFHHIEIDNQNLQMSLYASGSSYKDGIIEYDFFYEPWTFHYFTADVTPDGYDCLRDSFIGTYRTETNPHRGREGDVQREQRTGRESLRRVAEAHHPRPGRRKTACLHAGCRFACGGRNDPEEVREARRPWMRPSANLRRTGKQNGRCSSARHRMPA